MKQPKTYRGVIYRYTFPNGKVYIGQTNNPRSRMAQHLSEKTGARNVAFWRAYKKYGEYEYDEIEVIEESTAESLRNRLNQLEQLYIAKYKSTDPNYGYNLTSGGNIFVVNEEGRKHMSDARTDKKPVLQYDLNGNFIAEYESTIAAAKSIGTSAGSVWSCCIGTASGRRAKKVQIIKGYTFRFKEDYPSSPSHIDIEITTNRKKVLQFSLQGKFIKEWDSIVEAETFMNYCGSGIRQCCYGKYRQSNGYMWRFRSDFEEIPQHIAPVRNRVQRDFSHLTDEHIILAKQRYKEKYAKRILQFSFEGCFIKEYDSIEDAATAVNGDAATICNACKLNKVKSAYGFQWRYKSEISSPSNGIPPYRVSYGPRKSILQYTPDGEFVKEWLCAQDIADAYGIKRNTIYMALSGKRHIIKGYIWKYKQEM